MARFSPARARVLDDLARVADGAVSTLAGVKQDMDQWVRRRVEKHLLRADLVPREEFEAVQAMAAEARTEQARLLKRIEALEARPEAGAKPRSKSGAKPRAKSGAKPRAKSGAKPRPKPRPKRG